MQIIHLSLLFLNLKTGELQSNILQKTKTAIKNLQCIGFSFIDFFFFLAVKLKTMYCDRSAYYQKAIKATARQL